MGREMKEAYGQTIIDLAKNDERVCIVEADLMKSVGTKPFEAMFPQRAIECGVAEANMIGVSAGLCLQGFIPFASTFACFASRRVFDQFFLSGNYAKLNIKLTGSDPGVSARYNGGTHMPFEDLAMMKTIPNLVILEPSDNTSVTELVKLCYKHQGCTYTRLYRNATADIYDENTSFEIGKSKLLYEGRDITLIGLGALMMQEVLKARTILEDQGYSVSVIDSLWVKPLDKDLIRTQINKTGKVITCENHQIYGGLGSSVSDLITDENLCCKLKRIGINERFGQVGNLDFLMKDYKLLASDIVNKALEMLKKE